MASRRGKVSDDADDDGDEHPTTTTTTMAKAVVGHRYCPFGINYYLAHWDVYLELLIRYRNVPKLWQETLFARRAKPRVRAILLPLFVTLLFTVRSYVALIFYFKYRPIIRGSKLLRTALFDEFMPAPRIPFEIMTAIWSTTNSVAYLYELYRPLKAFEFMTFLVVDDHLHAPYKPNDLGLQQADFERLKRFRSVAFKLLSTLIGIQSVIMFVTISWTAYLNETYKLSWSLTIFWVVMMMLFFIYTSYLPYAMPVLLVMVVRYFSDRQASVQAATLRLERAYRRAISSTNKSCALARKLRLTNEFIHLCRTYVAFNRQLSKLNNFWPIYLTIIFSFYTSMISHCVFLLYVRRVDGSVRFFLGVTLNSLLIYLVLLIYHCSSIFEANRTLSGRMVLIYIRLVHHRLYPSNYYLVRLDDMMTNIRSHDYGLRLFNQMLISNKTYLYILLNTAFVYFKLTHNPNFQIHLDLN